MDTAVLFGALLVGVVMWRVVELVAKAQHAGNWDTLRKQALGEWIWLTCLAVMLLAVEWWRS